MNLVDFLVYVLVYFFFLKLRHFKRNGFKLQRLNGIVEKLTDYLKNA